MVFAFQFVNSRPGYIQNGMLQNENEQYIPVLPDTDVTTTLLDSYHDNNPDIPGGTSVNITKYAYLENGNTVLEFDTTSSTTNLQVVSGVFGAQFNFTATVGFMVNGVPMRTEVFEGQALHHFNLHLYLMEGTSLTLKNSNTITVINTNNYMINGDIIESPNNETLQVVSSIVMVEGMFQVTEKFNFYIHYLNQDDIFIINAGPPLPSSIVTNDDAEIYMLSFLDSDFESGGDLFGVTDFSLTISQDFFDLPSGTDRRIQLDRNQGYSPYTMQIPGSNVFYIGNDQRVDYEYGGGGGGGIVDISQATPPGRMPHGTVINIMKSNNVVARITVIWPQQAILSLHMDLIEALQNNQGFIRTDEPPISPGTDLGGDVAQAVISGATISNAPNPNNLMSPRFSVQEDSNEVGYIEYGRTTASSQAGIELDFTSGYNVTRHAIYVKVMFEGDDPNYDNTGWNSLIQSGDNQFSAKMVEVNGDLTKIRLKSMQTIIDEIDYTFQMNKMYHIYLDLKRHIDTGGNGKLYIIEDGVTTTLDLPSFNMSGRNDFGNTTTKLFLRAQHTAFGTSSHKYKIRMYSIAPFGDHNNYYPTISDIEGIVNN